MSLKVCLVVIMFVFFVKDSHSQLYEDRRCRCVCPSPASVTNSSLITTRKIFIASVPPSKCNCDGVILQLFGDEIKGHENEYCPRCECKYESRNSTIIMIVVVMVLWILLLMSVYMGFLVCLDPLVKRKKNELYREPGNESAVLLIGGEDDD